MSHTFTVTITDEEYRAMELILPSPEEWVNHAVTWKAFKSMLRVTDGSLDESDMLNSSDKAEIQQDLLDAGAMFLRKKDWPIEIHRKIAIRTKMKTREVRDAEELAALIKDKPTI